MSLSSRARGALVALVLALAACGGAPHGSASLQPPSPLSPVSPPSPVAPAAPRPQFPAAWPYHAGDAAPHAAHGMVVTDNATGTRVGVDVLATGDNAVDAAVATAFALAVAYPTAGNIGGGGFLVARIAGKSYALDFRETAPAAATRDMYLGPDGKPTKDSREGWRSVGVPGSVAGLWEAWNKLGSKKKTWAELLAPAIELAERGFVVDAPFLEGIGYLKQRLARFPASASLFLPNGAPPVLGTAWRDPDLAGVLRRIASEGPAGFYKGPVAETLARAMKDGGGLVTAADLEGYRARWRDPIEYRYRGRDIVGMPPPSSGGLTMAMIAHQLEGWDLAAAGWHTTKEVHLVAEAMRRAFAARNAKLGDPDFVKNPVEELLSDDWAKGQRATIDPDHATPTKALFPQLGDAEKSGPHTTNFCVVDGDGNAVALTTTLNAWYGSGVTVPGLGFVLNDEMDDFASVPGTANMFGLKQGEPNAIAPGKRMLSSMSPTLVLDSRGAVEFALGGAGGSRIITAVFEELSNELDFGMGASDAVRAPRFHQQDSPDVLMLEPHALPDDVVAALRAMGHEVKETEHLADAPGIGRSNGLWEAGPEPRRDGGLGLGL
jgi:gamma-glutamyltranspeptidase / glutathione hydrolase